MKIENKPSAYGFLAGLLVLLLAAFANASCAHASPLTSRGLTARYAEAVEISAVCVREDGAIGGWSGSGVIVSRTRILTAAHVAGSRGAFCVFSTKTIDGTERMVQPAVVLPDLDIASMTILDGETPFDFSPLAYGARPSLGDTVCAATAVPWRGHKCGEVQPDSSTPGDIKFFVVVEPGNSGSGLYNAAGELVGIVTHRFFCGGSNQTCGGKAASLAGHVDELLERTPA